MLKKLVSTQVLIDLLWLDKFLQVHYLSQLSNQGSKKWTKVYRMWFLKVINVMIIRTISGLETTRSILSLWVCIWSLALIRSALLCEITDMSRAGNIFQKGYYTASPQGYKEGYDIQPWRTFEIKPTQVSKDFAMISSSWPTGRNDTNVFLD